MIPKTKFFIENQTKDASRHVSFKIPKKVSMLKIMELSANTSMTHTRAGTSGHTTTVSNTIMGVKLQQSIDNSIWA